MQKSYQRLDEISLAKKSPQLIEGRYYLVDQEPDWSECLCGPILEKANEYQLYATDPGFMVTQPAGNVKEDSECFTRMCCICNRPFQITIKIKGEPAATLTRGCRCCIESCPCLNNEIEVTDPKGGLIGKVQVPWWCYAGQKTACADVRLVVTDSLGKTVYNIEGSFCQSPKLCPCFRCCYCPLLQYNVYDDVYLLVGKISNICNGVLYEVCTKASKFGVQFPAKCSDNNKLLLLSAAIFIDYLRYEGFLCL